MKFDLETVVDWKITETKKNKFISSFGIYYQGKKKWFEVTKPIQNQLWEILRFKVSFQNINKFYATLKMLNGGSSSQVIYSSSITIRCF
jgi:hypothetical protein